MANELKLNGSLVVGSYSSDPAVGHAGEIYYNTSMNKLRQYVNGSWQDVSTAATSLTGQVLNEKNVLVGNASNTSAAVDTASLGMIEASTSGLNIKAGNVTNTEISNSAAIARSKLATLTANRVVVTDGSGNDSASTITSTELGYVSGVTSAIQTQLNAKIPASEKGAASGVATLDSGGKVPVSQLPSAVMTYEGTWNASTNSPSLADGTGDAGMVYIVATAGTQNLGSGSISFSLGDWVVYNGTIWEKSVNSNAVASVNGDTGAVTVNAINQLTGDVTAGPASGSQSVAATIAAGAVTAGKLGAVTDGTTVDQNGLGSTIQVKDGGITTGKLANNAVIATKVSALADDASIEHDISTNKLKIKAVDGALLSAGSVTASKLGAVTDNVTLDQGGAGSTIQIKASGITDSHISSSAAIALSKLAGGTANRVPVTSNTGALAMSTAQDVELLSNSLARGLATGNVVTEKFVNSITLADNTATPTVVSELTFDHTVYAGVEICYTIKAGTNIRLGTLRVVSNGTDTSISDAMSEVNNCGISFTTGVSGSNTQIKFTSTNLGSARTMRADIKFFKA